MYAFGSIQTKSRFLGLSVGVQNIGQSIYYYYIIMMSYFPNSKDCIDES